MSQSPQRAHNVVILSQPAAAPAALDETPTVGAQLAAARLAAGLSLETVRAGTKVKIVHLEAIEAGDSARLPATPFAAGFVKAYAQFLGLDPEEFARAYRAEHAPAPEATEAPLAPVAAPAAAMARPGPEKLVAYFGIGATLVAVLWIAALAIAPHKERAAPLGETIAAAPGPAAPAAISEAPPAAASPEIIAENQHTDGDAVLPQSPTVVAAPVETQETPPAPETPAVAAVEPPAAEPPVFEPPAFEQPVTPPQAIETRVAQAPALEPPATAPQVAQPQATEPQALELPPPPAAPQLSEDAEPVAIEESAPLAVAQTAPAGAEDVAPAPVSRDPVIVAAEVTRAAAAKYPEGCARSAADVETVRIALDVTVEGRPDNLRVADTSNDCFDMAALAAARRMRFSPRLVDGAPSAEAGKVVTARFAK